MASESWFSQIESTVFTVVQAKVSKKIKNIYYTTKNETWMNESESTSGKFPTLYLHELNPAEIGQDLAGRTINAVLSTIEIQVYTNTSENECRKICTEAILAMKSLGYSVTLFPDPSTKTKVSTAVMRFRRKIGSGDIDFSD